MFSELAYVPDFTFLNFLPFLMLLMAGLIILGLDALLDVFIKGITRERRDGIITGFTFVAILATMLTYFFAEFSSTADPYLEGSFISNEFGNIGCLIILFAGLVFVAMSPPLMRARKLPAGEVFALLVFSLMGMVMLTVANELLTAFICIEILSLSLYVLVGIDRRNRKSSEASFKYFILGAFASAFLVLGIGFLFGATGTTHLFGNHSDTQEIIEARQEGRPYQLSTEQPSYFMGMDQVFAANERIILNSQPEAELVDGAIEVSKADTYTTAPLNPLWVYLGFILIFVGLCFKLSLAPFHMWAPDVYEGAPTIVALFVATASKVAAFAFLVHLVESMAHWQYFAPAALPLITVVAALSMIWGNVGALVQKNIKRMLAYSSIAHGGYIVVGIAALLSVKAYEDELFHSVVRNAILFYLFAYTLMNILAFGIPHYLNKAGEESINSYKGLSKRRPFIATGMAIAMISLLGLGIPGTIGFWGKFILIKEAMRAELYFLTIMMIVGSAISAYYYLSLIVQMYFREEDGAGMLADLDPSENNSGTMVLIGSKAVLVITAALTVIFGFLPFLFFGLS